MCVRAFTFGQLHSSLFLLTYCDVNDKITHKTISNKVIEVEKRSKTKSAQELMPECRNPKREKVDTHETYKTEEREREKKMSSQFGKIIALVSS